MGVDLAGAAELAPYRGLGQPDHGAWPTSITQEPPGVGVIEPRLYEVEVGSGAG